MKHSLEKAEQAMEILNIIIFATMFILGFAVTVTTVLLFVYIGLTFLETNVEWLEEKLKIKKTNK